MCGLDSLTTFLTMALVLLTWCYRALCPSLLSGLSAQLGVPANKTCVWIAPVLTSVAAKMEHNLSTDGYKWFTEGWSVFWESFSRLRDFETMATYIHVAILMAVTSWVFSRFKLWDPISSVIIKRTRAFALYVFIRATNAMHAGGDEDM